MQGVGRWVLRAGLGVIALVLLLSLGSFHPLDPHLFTQGSAIAPVQNLCGTVGANLAGLLQTLLGIGGWLVPPYLLWEAWPSAKRRWTERLAWLGLALATWTALGAFGPRLWTGLPEAGTVVGYVGQIDARKDPAGVVRFAEALGDVSLLFAGREEPETTAALGARLANSPLRDRTLRLGPQADLGPAFAALDLYAMTSRNEGFFPIALIEALERGVPVLAPTVGGIGTVMRDGEGGFLIPKPDDRKGIPESLLVAAAARLAPLLADPEAWADQRRKAHAFGLGLTRGYDAAARFREAVAPWL